MAMDLSNFIDTPVTLSDHPINHLICNAVQMQTFGEPKDILKLYVGVAGIQFCGVSFRKLYPVEIFFFILN